MVATAPCVRSSIWTGMGCDHRGGSASGSHRGHTSLPAFPCTMTPRTLKQVWEEEVGYVALLLGIVVLVLALVTWLTSCAAVEQDTAKVAQNVAPILKDGCIVVETVDPNPWIDFLCTTAEAADSLLARLPKAQVQSHTALPGPDGGTWHVTIVHMPLEPKFDAGAVIDAVGQ